MFHSSSAGANNKEEVSHLINVWLNYQKDAQHIPAIMAAVVKENEVYWSGGVGYANLTPNNSSSIKPNLAADANTLTNICSNSKVITAAAIMTLVEQEKLSLDSDVQQIIPNYSFTHQFTESGPVTIHSLLTHTSGLPRDTGHGYWSAPDYHFPNKSELIDSLSKLSTTTPVNHKVAYSNLGYAMLGATIEQVSGMSYQDYVEKHIFEALKMDTSAVEMQQELHGNKHAMGYSAKNRHGDRSQVGFFKTNAMQAAAGISTTANDWAKFALWQLDTTAQDSELMSASLKSKMTSPQTPLNNGRARGLGYDLHVDKQGDTWAMHGGMCPGFNSYMKLNIDKKQGVAVFTNANSVKAAAYVNGLNRILTLSENAMQAPKAKINTKDYAGFYDPFPWNSQYYIAPWQGGLIIMYLPSESLDYALETYQAIGNDKFVKLVNNKTTDELLTFVRNEAGVITHVKNGGNLHPKRDKKSSY